MNSLTQFWAQVLETNTCWLWQGATRESDSKVYGWFSWLGKTWRVHRLAYILTGGTIPDDCDVHHKCENTLCVRPNHLEALTRAEHEARHNKGTARTHCANGHELTPDNVYQRPQGWRECKICRAAPSYRGR